MLLSSAAPALSAQSTGYLEPQGSFLYPCRLHIALQCTQGGCSPLHSSLQGSFSVSLPSCARARPSVFISACKALRPGLEERGFWVKFATTSTQVCTALAVVGWFCSAPTSGHCQARTGTGGSQPGSALHDHSHPAFGCVCMVSMCETGRSDAGG